MDAPDLRTSFAALTGHPQPLAWQRELLENWLLPGRLPTAVDIPTGLGKTTVMALWLLALAMQMREGRRPALPRRLVYVVDRRAVVDQATTEAEGLRENLATKPALRWMREAFGLQEGEDLPVSTLRGQLADNRQWLTDPARPAIIVGTVDMIGSRLLFSGYGVSRRMRPYHAGLLGVDTLVLLDEAHLVPAFQRLLEGVAGMRDASPWHTGTLWPERDTIMPLRMLPLSATQIDAGDTKGEIFTLSEAALSDEITRERLQARKALELQPFDPGKKEDDSLALALAQTAHALLENEDGSLKPRRLIIYCDRRKVAEKLHDLLRKDWAGKRGQPEQAELELFTGARRVFERKLAAERLEKLGFIAGDAASQRDIPAILIATSAAEVGVDLDADDLICDLVPLERMIQRFGRVNRRGRRNDTRIIVLHPSPAPQKARHAAQLFTALQALRKLHGDASPKALRELAARERELTKEASTPLPLYPPLTLATVESWALTNIADHPGRPDIQPWLRGWTEDDQPQAEILWREYLPWPEGDAPKEKEVNAFFASARPHLLEVLETSAADIADVLIVQAKELKKKKDALEGNALDAWRQGVILLDRANRYTGYIRTENLAEMKKGDLAERIAFRRVVAPAGLGGLDEETGFLKKKATPFDDLPLDSITDPAIQQQLGFRVLASTAGKEGEEPDWRTDHRFNRYPDADADEERQEIIVKVWRGSREAPLVGDPAITRKEQKLREHLEEVEQEAASLAARLHLPESLRQILRLSARLHDLGKAHRRWQQAMNGDPQDPLAKTTGGNGRMLGGFRHELASVLDVTLPEKIQRLTSPIHRDLAADLRRRLESLEDQEQDLVLHLVAAHHGHARPLMPDIDDTLPPSALKPHVQAIALRYARLQKRFGPWGLAWLETLLRAADQRASAKLDAADASEEMEAHHG